MRQLSFIEQSAKENFINNIEDLRLYLKALDGITATILRDLKKRDNSVISVETLANIIAAVSSQLSLYHIKLHDDYAERVAEGQGLSNGATLRVVGGE